MAEKPLYYVVRHGETALNAQNKFRGSVDAPLNQQGRAHAFALVSHLHDVPATLIIHSTHKRAVDTASIIAHGLDAPAIRMGSAALKSWNFGKFSGKVKTPAVLRDFQQYLDHPDMKIPGGESLTAFRGRVEARLRTIDRAARNNGPLILVTSSSVIHEIARRCTGDSDACKIGPGGMLAVYRAGRIKRLLKGSAVEHGEGGS
jgi:broad specificity phosphatase PhoE